MKLDSFYKWSGKYFLFSLVLPTILFAGQLLWVHWKYKPENITSNIQKRVWELESMADEQINTLSALLKKNKVDFNLAVHFEDNFSVIVVRNDSLLFWSDNSVVLPEDLEEIKNVHSLKTPSGYYDIRHRHINGLDIYGFILLQCSYPYENQFLKSELTTNALYANSVDLSVEEIGYNLYNREKEFLYGVTFPEVPVYPGVLVVVFSLLYLWMFAGFNLMVIVLWRRFAGKTVIGGWHLAGAIIDLVVLRLLFLWIGIPEVISSGKLFSPSVFAFSDVIPSSGSLILYLISLVFILATAVPYLSLKIRSPRNNRKAWLLSSIYIAAINFLVFYLVFWLIGIVVSNSSISYDLGNIINLKPEAFSGFFAIALASFAGLSFLFPQNKLLIPGFRNKSQRGVLLTFAGMNLFIILLSVIVDPEKYLAVSLFSFGFQLIAAFSSRPGRLRFSRSEIFVSLFLLAGLITLGFSVETGKWERQQRQLLAGKFGSFDMLIPVKYSFAAEKITHDPYLPELLSDTSMMRNQKVAEYLERKYFSGYWSKFELIITVCDKNDLLTIRPDNITISCNDYFSEQIDSFGEAVASGRGYILTDEFGEKHFLGVEEIAAGVDTVSLYVEIFTGVLPRGLGYPELLREGDQIGTDRLLSNYSIARYADSTLVYRAGDFNYPFDLSQLLTNTETDGFYSNGGYEHYVKQLTEDSWLVLSRPSRGLFVRLAAYSYLLIFFGGLLLLWFILSGRIRIFRNYFSGFRQRLQTSVSLLIVATFIVTGAGTVIYIIYLNGNKNRITLREKSHSVLIELEHKLAAEDSLTPDMNHYISDLLYKFSEVFFSDINLYDPSGKLLATSREELFNRKIVSDRMHLSAFQQLQNGEKSLVIQQEFIGRYKYLSAYLPLRNFDNRLIGYVNLPYFAKQEELTRELSTFLAGFVNIYIILTALALSLSLLFANYITRPVRLLQTKLQNVKLGETSEKIVWRRKDEIGSLVAAYNRMLDELAESAGKLAQSERESAWREMARQIAHEIKNPLTPMKLSVQYLQKAWDEKQPDWEERLRKFTRTIIEQIDALSVIASAFSDFARMPKSNFIRLNIVPVIESAAGLFMEQGRINIQLDLPEELYVTGDRDQVLRVFNNLIKNAVQAIGSDKSGNIWIEATAGTDFHIIRVIDDGPGIPSELKEKIFYPNFTTKSAGMGLGLALVRSIILNMEGSIDFESRPGRTVFTLRLPVDR